MRGLNLVDRDAHRVAQVDVLLAPVGDMPIVKFNERRGGPGCGVHAVGDRRDRIAWKHAARDLAVPHRDAVDKMRKEQRQMRQIQRPVETAPHARQPISACRAENAAREVEGELIVTRRHRRVGREDAALADRLDPVSFAALLAFEQREG